MRVRILILELEVVMGRVRVKERMERMVGRKAIKGRRSRERRRPCGEVKQKTNESAEVFLVLKKFGVDDDFWNA